MPPSYMKQHRSAVTQPFCNPKAQSAYATSRHHLVVMQQLQAQRTAHSAAAILQPKQGRSACVQCQVGRI
jgi:hypothetical protein